MGEKTEKNLARAFAAESKASVRNAAFALKAEKEDFQPVANLFKAVAESESVHANRFLLLMRGKIGSTEDNLKTAFENEIKANANEYPQIIKEAEGYNRNFFTGIFGIYDGKRLESSVMIRFIERINGSLYFKSGGGITYDSDANAEYREMIDKVYIPV